MTPSGIEPATFLNQLRHSVPLKSGIMSLNSAKNMDYMSAFLVLYYINDG
jgi:hypothetical protein